MPQCLIVFPFLVASNDVYDIDKSFESKKSISNNTNHASLASKSCKCNCVKQDQL